MKWYLILHYPIFTESRVTWIYVTRVWWSGWLWFTKKILRLFSIINTKLKIILTNLHHINKNSFLCNYMYGIEQFKQLLLSIIVFSSTIFINPHWSNGRKEVWKQWWFSKYSFLNRSKNFFTTTNWDFKETWRISF